MKIAIGADHGGFELKEYLIENLKNDYEIIDKGCYDKNSVDYPLIARDVCKELQNKNADMGICICTNGVGITIAANKFKGIRCALCLNEDMASHARLHNDANVISFGEVNQPNEVALKMARTFFETAFTNEERHARRVNEIIKFDEEN